VGQEHLTLQGLPDHHLHLSKGGRVDPEQHRGCLFLSVTVSMRNISPIRQEILGPEP
jgi:hypothetical protein